MPEPEITIKNTKAEILDALDRALKRAEAAEKGRLNPEKVEKERNEKRAVETAVKAVEANIFSKELTDKFKDLQAAIAAEEARLSELYGVGREVQKLALAIEAGRERIAEIEAERAEKELAAKTALAKCSTEFAQKNAELQAEYDALTKRLKTDRARENEEHQYTLARSREKENNAWADEKATREAALERKEAEAAALLAEAESRAGYIRSLEEKVEGFAGVIAAEREAAAAAVTEALTREHAHEAALSEMERKGAVSRLEDRVKYLEKELESAVKAVGVLQGKLDKAYSEMRDLATKTVESAGGVRIIGNPEKSGA